MRLAGNIITHFVAPVHQRFAACQPGDVQSISACVRFQHVNSISSSPSALASYHLCQQSCMKSVRNGNSAGLIVARNLRSDARTREVNGNFLSPLRLAVLIIPETLTCIVKFLNHPDRWSSEPIFQFRQCVKPFRENLTEPLSSAVNHFLDASEPLEEVHGQSSVSSKHLPGAVVVTVAIAVGTFTML